MMPLSHLNKRLKVQKFSKYVTGLSNANTKESINMA
jgi:hypothetical protein